MKKIVSMILAVLLLTVGAPVWSEPAEKSWGVFETSVKEGLQDMEFNGSLYVGSNNSDVFISKDAMNWEKVSVAKSAGETNTEVKGIYLTKKDNKFLLEDAAGKYFLSADGVNWAKSEKLETAASCQIELSGEQIRVIRDSKEMSFSTVGIGDVTKLKAKVINENLLVFAADPKEAKNTVIFRSPLDFDNPNKLKVNGRLLSAGVDPMLVNGRMLVPFRAIVEALGGEVGWDEKTSTVTVKKGATTILLQIESAAATVNGVEKKLEVPAKLVNDRTLVPVRFISEALGAEVIWDYLSNTAVVWQEESKAPTATPTPASTPAPTPTPTPTPTPSPSATPGDDGKSGNSKSEKEKIIDKYETEAAKLRNEGNSQLTDIINKAKSEYNNLPAEQRTFEDKMKIVDKLMPEAEKADTEIRSKFDAMKEKMGQELQSKGYTTESVDAAQKRFDQERQDKINELLSKL